MRVNPAYPNDPIVASDDSHFALARSSSSTAAPRHFGTLLIVIPAIVFVAIQDQPFTPTFCLDK